MKYSDQGKSLKFLDDSIERKRKFLIFIGSFLVILTTAGFQSYYYLIVQSNQDPIAVSMAVVCILNLLFLIFTKNTTLSSHFFVILCMAYVTHLIYIDTDPSLVDIVWTTCVPMVIYFLNDKKTSLIWLTVFLCILFSVLGLQITRIKMSPFSIVGLVQSIVANVLIIVMIYFYKDATEKSRADQLEQSVKKLLAENEMRQAAEVRLDKALKETEYEKLLVQQHVEELKKFELALANASDQILITNVDGVILYANKASETVSGFKSYELINSKADVFSGAIDDNIEAELWDTIKNKKERYAAEMDLSKKDATKFIAEVMVVPILDASSALSYFLVVERDITKAKEIDRAKTEFVSLASHQLRTPLSAVKWNAEVLSSGKAGVLTEKQMTFIRQIQESNTRMAELVNSLLDVSRLDLGTMVAEPETVSMAAQCDSILNDLLVRISEKSLTIEKQYMDNPPTIFIDPKSIRMVLENLITNAVKYTPKEGRITIDIHADAENMYFSIKDTGYGIPKSSQDRIFTKLYRAENILKKDTDGNGLGLYMVKAILEKMGGSIRFESEENVGTTFYVQIPITKQ